MNRTFRIIALLAATAACLAVPASAFALTVETLPPDSTVLPGSTHPYTLTPAYGLHAHWAWLQGKSDGSNITAHGGRSRCGTVVTHASSPSVPSCDGNDRIVIAVLDSGVDTSLPVFQGAGKVQPGIKCDNNYGGSPDYSYYCTTNPGDAQTDGNGHGTRVAGTALGQGNVPGQYGDGVYGVAPGAALLPVRTSFYEQNLKVSVRAAVQRGADVINISGYTGQASNPDLALALQEAHDAGVIVTCAAGNGNGSTSHDHIDYPALDPNCLGVGMLDGGGDAFFVPIDSSYGPAGEVDFAAPGAGVTTIETSYGGQTRGPSPTRGTSFASPAIAGAAAVLLANGIAPANVASTLAATARRIGTVEQTGAGLPDLGAVFGLSRPTHEVADPAPPAGGTGTGAGSTGGATTPTNPTACTGLKLSVPVGGLVSFANRVCTGAYKVTRSPEPALGSISSGAYLAPAAHVGVTSFAVTSTNGAFTQTVTVTVTKQVVTLAKPTVVCVAYKLHGRTVRGSKRCTIKTAVAKLAGGGSATLTIQKAVKAGTRTVWKAAGSCSLAATGKAASCAKVLASGSYRASVSVAQTTLVAGDVSTQAAFAA